VCHPRCCGGLFGSNKTEQAYASLALLAAAPPVLFAAIARRRSETTSGRADCDARAVGASRRRAKRIKASSVGTWVGSLGITFEMPSSLVMMREFDWGALID
jgi:hypothetical protein